MMRSQKVAQDIDVLNQQVTQQAHRNAKIVGP